MKVLNLIHWAQAHKTRSTLLAIDAKKAFDRVSWSIIKHTLQALGFGPRWLEWLAAIYSKPTARIRINGQLSQQVQITNGTRQGCPLSPLLFILILEPFLQGIRDNPQIKGIRVNDHEYKVMAFADDLLFTIANPLSTIPTIISEMELYGKISHFQIPKSVCSEKCLPGTRKVLRRGTQTCCYDCVPCSDGEITNRTDSENCEKCLSNEWPNERKDRCIPKLEEFLSYRNDTIAIILSSLSIFCFLITFMILVIFIWYQDTPIVKANNKNLSFVLLVSIMLSFLCVFLFLGRPVDITCMLRQTAFGILFSIAISCILGKTIIIYIVFKATQPGSVWKSFVSLKVSNCFVFCCSAVQIIINVIWLAIAPPFMELDTHSHQGTIIIQCNEGSVIAFYSVLGYMGFLAAVSFIMAFLARTLPDSFNEAKYITFSMLVFCSVWIAMIPAYLSTKGKYMVAVEIFAILTSSAGLLACIFFPKSFNIIFTPEINTKSHLYGGINKIGAHN
ncbi:vomeronasal type-2 receptor 26-like [Pelobates fuscus]|uniref:vomeronasal type-2 receptor 26-like n=1 Tax=Pelobates fuscus TaxID=191477 RepID=UPI002FE4F3CC